MTRRAIVLPTMLGAFLLLAAVPSLQAQVTPDRASAFMGDWTATMEGGPQGAISLDISIADEDGTLAGQVSSAQGGTTDVEEFSMSGDDLVLSYTVDFGGQSAPIDITLTPNGETLGVALALGGGAGGFPPITGTAERQ